MKKILLAAFVLLNVSFTQALHAQTNPPQFSCAARANNENFGGRIYSTRAAAEASACNPCKEKYSARACHKGCQTYSYSMKRWVPIIGETNCR